MKEGSSIGTWILSGAIVIAGIAVAAAIIYVKNPGMTGGNGAGQSGVSLAPGASGSGGSVQNLPPVTTADHIIGSLDAPVVIVEYADTDCPYCQAFQKTLQQIMAVYGPGTAAKPGTNQVAWVYRHFAFHPKAPKEAQATECAAEQGGNDAFWKYLDLLFSQKDFSQVPYEGLDPGQLPVLAGQIGLDTTAFTTCLESGKYATKITQEYNDAIASGAQGTPYTVLVTATARIPITAGAVPYANVKAAIDTLLNSKPQ
jgi:protein-disulfide isomerase